MKADIFRVDGFEAWDLISAENLASLGPSNREIMHRSIMNSSRVWVGTVDGVVMALWGLIPPTLMSDTAYLWLYTTDRLPENIFLFVRHSQRAVQAMLAEYPIIVGHGRVGADRSLRWLRWLGAEFDSPQGEFLPFTIKASQSWRPDSVQSA